VMVQHLPAQIGQRVPDSMGHMVTEVVLQYDDIPREHDETLSIDGVMKVLEYSTTWLYRALECDRPRVVD
jgi:hypothetical protein